MREKPWLRRKRSSTSAGAVYLDRDAAVERLAEVARAAARREPGIRRLILFGSLVRGAATPASDVDLVVVTDRGARRRMDRVPPLLELLADSPLPVDLHPYTVDEWREGLERGDPVPRRALAEGIDLLGGDEPGRPAERGPRGARGRRTPAPAPPRSGER